MISKKKKGGPFRPALPESYLVYGQKSVIDAIGVEVRANDGLVVVNACGQGFGGARETDHNGVQRPFGSVGRGFTGFYVESHKTAVAKACLAHHIGTAINAVDESVSPVDAGKI